MTRRLAILAALLLPACAARVPVTPEPIIKTVEVKVPVVQPCPAADLLGAAPAYPDTDDALAAAPNLYERVRLLLAGRTLRIAREASTKAALQACG